MFAKKNCPRKWYSSLVFECLFLKLFHLEAYLKVYLISDLQLLYPYLFAPQRGILNSV